MSLLSTHAHSNITTYTSFYVNAKISNNYNHPYTKTTLHMPRVLKP